MLLLLLLLPPSLSPPPLPQFLFCAVCRLRLLPRPLLLFIIVLIIISQTLPRVGSNIVKLQSLQLSHLPRAHTTTQQHLQMQASSSKVPLIKQTPNTEQFHQHRPSTLAAPP